MKFDDAEWMKMLFLPKGACFLMSELCVAFLITTKTRVPPSSFHLAAFARLLF